jgi:hypothetical protein
MECVEKNVIFVEIPRDLCEGCDYYYYYYFNGVSEKLAHQSA